MPDLKSKGLNYLEERFKVTEKDLEGLELVENHGDLWLSSKETSGYELETRGIRAVRVTGIGLKPTTYLLQYLDDSIEKNTVELNDSELKKLLKREEMVSRRLESEGYVALKYENRVIGCGFYKNEKVSSRVPKGRSQELLNSLF